MLKELKNEATTNFSTITVDEFANIVIKLKIIESNIIGKPGNKEKTLMCIIELLIYFRKTETHGMKFLHKVGIFLSNNLIGRRILDANKVFDGYRNSLFYEKISKQNIHFILENLKDVNIQNSNY
jgi:hypothetical protein